MALLTAGSALAKGPERPGAGAGERSVPAADLLESGLPALISADQLTYDEDLGIITASGNVEVSQGERVLVADAISYNLRSDIVTASGNVSLLEPSGEVLFADFVELTGNLREGFIKEIRVLLSDRSRLAAASGLRTGGNKTVFRRGVFSPCEPCREDPSRPPLWQIKAAKIVHDQQERTIRYGSAWLEFFGVPVLYTPYFEHPDPTVERKSGLLAPTIGSSDTLGAVVQVPYFWNIAPTMDATFEPIFTSKQSVVLAGEFRHLLPFGLHDFSGSATIADRERNDGSTQENTFRGHIDATGAYDINEYWRAGFDIYRASDDTYLRLYNFDNSSFLTSNIFAERLEGRDYFAVNALAFQGLREEDENDESPIVAPLIDLNLVSEPWIADSIFAISAKPMVLTRVEGRDTRRLDLKGSWELPFRDPIGGDYNLSASLQAAGYWTSNFVEGDPDPNPPGPTETEYSGRIFPQLALSWEYPWVRPGESFSQVLEPQAQVVVGTDPDQDDIPNEDSLDFELDDTNLFSLNRFPGVDRVSPGQRVDYGLNWQATSSRGGQAGLFVGQSYRLSREEDLYPDDSGLQDRLSDIVGRVSLEPIRYVDLLYRFRLDKEDFSPRRNEVNLELGPPALNLSLDYLSIDSFSDGTDLSDREQIDLRLRSRLNENWSAFVATLRDLERDDTLSTSLGLTYKDECFLISLIGKRRYFSDREIEPDDSIFIQISFKHLGGFSSP
jgi:LPS-assembly protein